MATQKLKSKNYSKPARITAGIFAMGLMFPLTQVSSMSAANAYELEKPDNLQTLYAKSVDLDMPVTELEVTQSQEYLDRVAAEQEQAERDRVAAEERAAEESRAAEQVTHEAPSYPQVTPGAGADGLVAAALAQVGTWQDCTDLVQNSLAAIGLATRTDQGGFDLGTGIWDYDQFGTRVGIDNLMPGDILIYGNAGTGAHVAVYIGNGQAVHGGFSAGTVIFNAHINIPLTGAIRL